MGETGRKFRQHMLMCGYSEATRESYEQAVAALARAYGGASPDQLSCDQVQAFLADLTGEKKRAWSTVNVYVSAFRCFYQDVLGRVLEREPAERLAVSGALATDAPFRGGSAARLPRGLREGGDPA